MMTNGMQTIQESIPVPGQTLKIFCVGQTFATKMGVIVEVIVRPSQTAIALANGVPPSFASIVIPWVMAVGTTYLQ